ncbi:radical SAM protein [Acidobacteriota bacterium]
MHYFAKYREELLEIISEHSDRFEEIGIPVQSGSNAILKAMKRRYNVTESLEIFQQLKQIAPNVRLATHIMIGFPGETDQDQINTIDFLKASHFDDILFYFYDDRPGTEASQIIEKPHLSVMRK